jgi:hypothetical protein
MKVSVKDKQEGIAFILQLNGNTRGQFLLYRVITSAGTGLCQTWDTPEEARKSFRMMSLI